MSVESNITKSDNWFIDEDKTLEFTVLQSDGSTAENITGWAIQFTLCDRDDAMTEQFSKSTEATGGGEITLTDPTNGVLQVTVLKGDYPSGMAPGKFQYELSRIDVGSEAVLAHGTALLQNIC